jgi:hypothetical protein
MLTWAGFYSFRRFADALPVPAGLAPGDPSAWATRRASDRAADRERGEFGQVREPKGVGEVEWDVHGRSLRAADARCA